MQSEAIAIPDNPVQIVPATWRDLNELRKLEAVCFPQDGWTLLDLAGILSIKGIVRFKAIIDEKMIGFIAGEQGQTPGIGWIATVAVLPEYRRQGIGSALLNSCEAALETETICLTVRDGNKAAIQLYRGHGYQQTGRRSNYYNRGSDALVFEKTCHG